MNIIALILTLIFCFLVLALPRKYATLPFLICLLYLPRDPGIEIGGLHLFSNNILVIFGILRLIIRGEFYLRETDNIILFIILWTAVGFTANFLLWGTIVSTTGGASISRYILTCLGLYIYFKSVIRSYDDIIATIKLLPLFFVPVALSMLWESRAGQNIFSLLGNVTGDEIRNGKFRCQGPFKGNILAGMFGATVMPLIAAMWFQKSYRKIWCIVGLVSSFIIVITSVSSGAITSLVMEIIAFGFWHLRNQMHMFRRGLIAILIGLMLMMKAPVWYLSARLSDFVGGDGWHRARILDLAFGPHFHEWWLIGTQHTGGWMPYNLGGFINQSDITNQFLLEGVEGGIFTMAFFIFTIVCCFKAIGNALHRNENAPLPQRMLLWALGVTLFGHVVSFMSVSYYDQSVIWYYLLIGMIGAISAIPLLSAQKQ